MIEPCPNCGKQPALFEVFWQCDCDSDKTGVMINGPDNDESGEGWNAMVRRMRQQPSNTYPERVRALRKKLAKANARIGELEVSMNVHKSQAMTLLGDVQSLRSERDEWKVRAEKAEAELAELRAELNAERGAVRRLEILSDGVGEAWKKYLDACKMNRETTPQPRQNWNEVRDLPVGTRLVSDEIEAEFPGGYIEIIGGRMAVQHGKYSGKLACGFLVAQHNWRPYHGMTWTQLNETAKVGDRATCGKFRSDEYLEKRINTGWLDDWKMIPEYRDIAPKTTIGWADQTDWRIL